MARGFLARGERQGRSRKRCCSSDRALAKIRLSLRFRGLRGRCDRSNTTPRLANSENLTPQPPSLAGKGESESPSPLRGGVGEGSHPSLIDQHLYFQPAGDLTRNFLSQSLAKATVSVIRNQQHPFLNFCPSFRRHPHGCLFTLHHQIITVEVIFPSFCFFLR